MAYTEQTIAMIAIPGMRIEFTTDAAVPIATGILVILCIYAVIRLIDAVVLKIKNRHSLWK
jgi:hypothetical protein